MKTPAFPGLAGRLPVPPAFRYRDFRLFWSGLLMSVLGFQLLQVTHTWLVYDLTESARYLALLGLVTAVPTIVLNLFGGVVADRFDQRRLLIVTQGTSALLIASLATLAAMEAVTVAHLLVVAFVSGAVLAFDTPSRQSLYPHLIHRDDLMNAVALNTSIWQGTRIIGPAIGGVVIARAGGAAAAYYLAALGFLIMVGMLSAIRVPPIERGPAMNVLKSMGEGIGFIRGNGVFAFLIGLTFFNSFFGMSFIFLLPIFAEDILGVGSEGFGYLHAASGIGALGMTFVAAALGKTRWKGPLLIGGATTFGLLLIAFALSRSYPLSLVILFLMGSSSTLYMVLVMTTLQARVPDRLRGRVMGIYGMTWSLLPLGAVQSGFVADLVSAPFAVAVGGAAVAAFALGLGASSRRVRGIGLPTAEAGAVSLRATPWVHVRASRRTPRGTCGRTARFRVT